MKTRTLVMMFTLICLTSFSFAGQMTGETGDQKGEMMSKGMMMGKEKGMGGHMIGSSMMYSMMVNHVLMKANALDLRTLRKRSWRRSMKSISIQSSGRKRISKSLT